MLSTTTRLPERSRQSQFTHHPASLLSICLSLSLCVCSKAAFAVGLLCVRVLCLYSACSCWRIPPQPQNWCFCFCIILNQSSCLTSMDVVTLLFPVYQRFSLPSPSLFVSGMSIRVVSLFRSFLCLLVVVN